MEAEDFAICSAASNQVVCLCSLTKEAALAADVSTNLRMMPISNPFLTALVEVNRNSGGGGGKHAIVGKDGVLQRHRIDQEHPLTQEYYL